ncbi:MAG: flagellar export chaperone FlgN [Betaproteobacteria bacterium]
MEHANPSQAAPLRNLLQAEYHALCQYVSLSEQENNALAESDPETIAQLANQKQFLLNELTRARSITKYELGEPISAAKLGARLESAGPGTRDLFDLIIAKAREAMEINRITSRLIAHQSRRLEQRHAALSGSGLNTPASYGAHGFQQSKFGYGSIGRA